jgi:putative transposase
MIVKLEPSSKICHVYRHHNSELTLKDREWKCPDCKTKHDRDIEETLILQLTSQKSTLLDQNLIEI